jgi:L-threonylcarbamoyladenylate synthase
MSANDLPDDSEIERAVAVLRSGGLVAFPTETVYGLGADATNTTAVQRIFAAKGRPTTNPLIVHISDASVARRYVTHWPESAAKLADQFWPGPLTLVLPRASIIVPEVSAGLSSVGLRSPDHPVALALLRQFNGPIAAPSANRANRISPTAGEHVRQELGDAVDLILDGGPCKVGIESTVLELCRAIPRILRLGAITREQIQEVIGRIESSGESVDSATESSLSPGKGTIHYSPAAPAFGFESDQIARLKTKLDQMASEPVTVLVIKDSPASKLIRTGTRPGHRIIELPYDPVEYARRMYAVLREADQPATKAILVEMPPGDEHWIAIRDRMRRATQML